MIFNFFPGFLGRLAAVSSSPTVILSSSLDTVTVIMEGFALERVLVRALVLSLGKGMAEGIGGMMAVVTVDEKGTLIGVGEDSSSSSDS